MTKIPTGRVGGGGGGGVWVVLEKNILQANFERKTSWKGMTSKKKNLPAPKKNRMIFHGA